MKLSSISGLAALAATYSAPAASQTVGQTLTESCASLPIKEACALIQDAARMLAPSYEDKKATDGKAAFEALGIGYKARYVPAKHGLFSPTIDVFLVAKQNSNTVFIVITGTESKRDWLENAKFRPYTAKYKDGQFYVPPGHAGFRRGMLSIVGSGIFKINEFDTAPLNCSQPRAKASIMSQFICEANLKGDGDEHIQAVIVGHSRGSAIGQIIAAIVDGFEFKSGPNKTKTVDRQAYWPLRLKAMIGFAPPYAVYSKTDREAGLNVPQGVPGQWDFFKEHGYADKTILFINDRDAVPIASLGHGRHFGHRYRITGYGAVLYDGQCWGSAVSAAGAHSSVGYAKAVTDGQPVMPRCE